MLPIGVVDVEKGESGTIPYTISKEFDFSYGVGRGGGACGVMNALNQATCSTMWNAWISTVKANRYTNWFSGLKVLLESLRTSDTVPPKLVPSILARYCGY